MKPCKTVQKDADAEMDSSSAIEARQSYRVRILSTKLRTHIYRVQILSAGRRSGLRREGQSCPAQVGPVLRQGFGQGKEVWKSLKTSHFSVAQARLAEFLKDHRQRVGNGGDGKDSGISAKMTFGEAAESHLRDLDNNVKIKPRTPPTTASVCARWKRAGRIFPRPKSAGSRRAIARRGRAGRQGCGAEQLQQHRCPAPACVCGGS